MATKSQMVERLRVQLEERSPLRLLERGYAICYDATGNVVQAADSVAIGDRIRVQLSRGRLGAEVKETEVPQPEMREGARGTKRREPPAGKKTKE
jgi:exodeoxyribonuclease VII large subunit